MFGQERSIHPFFRKRQGACQAPPGQHGFDSALWCVAEICEPPLNGPFPSKPILILFENKASTDEDKRMGITEVKKKLKLIRKELGNFNQEDPQQTILEEDVVVVFAMTRSMPKKSQSFLKPEEWGGSLIILCREFLTKTFYRSLFPFFREEPSEADL